MNSKELILNLNLKNTRWLAEHNLSVEDVFVLKVFRSEELDILKEYLTFMSSDSKLVYLQRLVRKGFLEMFVDVDEFSWDNYSLSDEAEKVLDYLEEDMIKEVELVNLVSKEEITGVVDQKVIKDQEKETTFDKFVEEFRSKFPEGKNGGNVSFRGNPIDIKNKLHKFMNKYKHDMKTILDATDLYLAGFRRKGFEFCQAAEYFIMKNQTSTLAGYCELVKKNGTGGVGNIVNPFEQTM